MYLQFIIPANLFTPIPKTLKTDVSKKRNSNYFLLTLVTTQLWWWHVQTEQQFRGFTEGKDSITIGLFSWSDFFAIHQINKNNTFSLQIKFNVIYSSSVRRHSFLCNFFFFHQSQLPLVEALACVRLLTRVLDNSCVNRSPFWLHRRLAPWCCSAFWCVVLWDRRQRIRCCEQVPFVGVQITPPQIKNAYWSLQLQDRTFRQNKTFLVSAQVWAALSNKIWGSFRPFTSHEVEETAFESLQPGVLCNLPTTNTNRDAGV